MIRRLPLRAMAHRVAHKGVARVANSRFLSFNPGFLSDKDFLDAAPLAAGRSATTATVAPVNGVDTNATTPYTPPVALPYQPIRLGVQLTKFGVNLTKMAADGELEKVIGREDEIQQAIQILSRRRKNNPCLIGEPGVGTPSYTSK
jgi:ATP-dependent Clp protease ATP-binding subunit ClpA